MVETFATSQYKEKFFGNLTLTQSLIMILLATPGLLMTIEGYPAMIVLPYGLVCTGLYAAIVFYNFDEQAMMWLGFTAKRKRLLWKTRDMKDFIGVDDIDSDTVFTQDSRLLSVVKVSPKDLASLSESDIERVLAGYGIFLHELSTNIQIIMSSTEIDMEGYLRKLRERVLLSDRLERLNYFEHFSEFMRGIIQSKTVTDRDYYIIITQARSENIKKSLEDLDTKTRNLVASLRDAAIDCERLDTTSLIRFYSNFYNSKFKLAGDTWNPVTFHENMEGMIEAEKYLERVRNNLDLAFPMYDECHRPGFDGGGLDHVRNPIDRRSFIIEQLMPSSVDRHKDYAEIEKLHRVLFTVRFPAIVHPGWLTKLIRQPIDFDIVFHIHPLNQKTSIDYLQHEITKLETDVTAKERDGLLVAEKDKVNLQKVKELLNRVTRDEEKCFDVALYVNVKAYTRKELDVAVMRIKDVIEGMNAQVRVANWEMSDALRSCYPLAEDRLGERRDRLFPSSAVRDSYPFILSSLEDKGSEAIVVGYNQLNGIPVLVDLFQQPNPHALVLGSSGSGKSFLVKKIFLCEAMQDIDMYIIDPQGEYSNIVEEMGGEVIRLAPDSKSVINLFNLSHDSYNNRKGSIKAFFNIICGNMDDKLTCAVEGIIDKMVDNAYRKAGIYPDDPGTWSRKSPTFSNIYDALNQFASEYTSNADSWKKTTAEALLTYITPFVTGDMSYLNQNTTVNLAGKNIVCFDISSTTAYKPAQRALALFIVFDFIYCQISKEREKKRKIIIVDEAWSVFENNQDYIGPIIRTGRKDNISVIMIDQNVEDLLAKDGAGRVRGHIVLNNTSTKFLLRQEAAALKMICEKFALTEGQRLFLQNAGTGDVLMLTPTLKLPLFVLASEREHNMLSTTPEQEIKTELKRPTTLPDITFNTSRDLVLPAALLSRDDLRRLGDEGYSEVVDTGLSRDERTLYYVREVEGEDTIHFLRKFLIYKHIEAMRTALGLKSDQVKASMHDRIIPDITFNLPAGQEVAIEVLTLADVESPDHKSARKHEWYKTGDGNVILIYVALSEKVKEAAQARGYFDIIMSHEVVDRVGELVKSYNKVSEYGLDAVN